MSLDRGMAVRAKRALVALAYQEGEPIAIAEIGRRMKRFTGSEVPQQTISKWFRGTVPERVEDRRSLARVLKVDPGWLEFGPASAAPAPSWWKAEMGGPVKRLATKRR